MESSKFPDNVSEVSNKKNRLDDSAKKGFFLLGLFIAIIMAIFMIGVYVNQNRDDGSLDYSKIMAMSDSELFNLFYNSSSSQFADDLTRGCEYRRVVDNSDEAIEDARYYGIDKNKGMLFLELEDETESYYIVHRKYSLHQDSGDKEIENKYLYFKKTVFDVNNKTINLEVLSNAAKIKSTFDTYFYTDNIMNEAVRMVSSKIEEDEEKYTYSCYYFMSLYGDWRASSESILYENSMSVEKQTGKYNLTETAVRKLSGGSNITIHNLSV